MDINILGAESLGVRGLSCLVHAGDRKVLIDPGLALGYQRQGLLPHPVQVAVGECVRKKLLTALRGATDVVFSHYHGDHVPLPDPNPYQLGAQQAAPYCRTVRMWAKGDDGLSENMIHRKGKLSEILDRDLPNAENQIDGWMAFSPAVPHGQPGDRQGKVMMTRIEDKETVFVHASDIQLLNSEAISIILDWKPDIALVGGPPLYLPRVMDQVLRTAAWEGAVRLASSLKTLILDHHLLRSEEGITWLERLSADFPARVCCAADYMDQSRLLLEAKRSRYYQQIPVPENWHNDYAQGKVDTETYHDRIPDQVL